MAPSDQNDLLDARFKMRLPDGHPMSDRELRDEMMRLLFAGHETTAVALSWTWYLLSLNKQTETTLEEELDTVLGDREPTIEDIPRLRYTEWVIKESMRLYPPAWGIGRRALADFEEGGHRLPAETNAFLIQWITHRDERFILSLNASGLSGGTKLSTGMIFHVLPISHSAADLASALALHLL